MLKKTISSWMTLLAALLLVGCTSSNTIKQTLLAQKLQRKMKFRLPLPSPQMGKVPKAKP